QALVSDASDLEAGVDHLGLVAHAAHDRQLGAREPGRQTHVHRALVGADADAGEEPGVGLGVVAVEGVRLAPRRVTLDGMGEVVTLVQDGHGPEATAWTPSPSCGCRRAPSSRSAPSSAWARCTPRDRRGCGW